MNTEIPDSVVAKHNKLQRKRHSMAKVTTTSLVDDLDGSTENVESLQFLANGKVYEIELSAENRAPYEELIEKFLSVKPEVVGKADAGKSSSTGAVDTKNIREWAIENGMEVNPRGRLNKSVIDAYNKAKGK